MNAVTERIMAEKKKQFEKLRKIEKDRAEKTTVKRATF